MHIPYQHENTLLEGYVVYPKEEKRPLVIVCHSWSGLDEIARKQIDKVASLGYVGFGLDMYGKGIVGKTKEENAAFKKPFIEDRAFLLRRALKGLEVASTLPGIDSRKIAVLGFGFGGLCALDLARSGAYLLGAISIYGHFDPLPRELQGKIKGEILLIHGYKDPVVKYEDLQAFQKRLGEDGVDWQTYLLGGAGHAFMTDPLYAARAWKTVENFLKLIFDKSEKF